MSKFKFGEKVYCIRNGIGTVRKVSSVAIEYAVEVTYSESKGWGSFTYDGRENIKDKNPTLLTLSEARNKGYDVPKETVKRSEVRYCTPEDLDGTFCEMLQSPAHVQTGFPIVTATFTWEEET